MFQILFAYTCKKDNFCLSSIYTNSDLKRRRVVFNENEVAMLLLCFGVFIFIITKRREYKRIPYWGLILASFYMFFLAGIFTVVEDLVFPVLFNILEHVLYMLSSFMLLLWCWMTFRRNKGGEE